MAAKVAASMPSREEATDLTGYDDPRRALAELGGLPTAIIVIKMGPDGCLVGGRALKQAVAVSTSPGPVVEVTGAGDAFCGGMAAGLARGPDPGQCAGRGAGSPAFAPAALSSPPPAVNPP